VAQGWRGLEQIGQAGHEVGGANRYVAGHLFLQIPQGPQGRQHHDAVVAPGQVARPHHHGRQHRQLGEDVGLAHRLGVGRGQAVRRQPGRVGPGDKPAQDHLAAIGLDGQLVEAIHDHQDAVAQVLAGTVGAHHVEDDLAALAAGPPAVEQDQNGLHLAQLALAQKAVAHARLGRP
jgi:hypothetical protein